MIKHTRLIFFVCFKMLKSTQDAHPFDYVTLAVNKSALARVSSLFCPS